MQVTSSAGRAIPREHVIAAVDGHKNWRTCLDAGHLRVGDRADFYGGLERMVNRNDSTASAVKWPTRETAVLRLVIVHWVEGGKITLWKDDWDVWG